MADICLVGQRKNDLELNGDAGMFSTFDHGDSQGTSRLVTGGSTIRFSRKYRPPRLRWHALWENPQGHAVGVNPEGRSRGGVLGFRNLSPCIFERHGSVKEECVG